jgi:hypothetical protein
MAQKIRQPKVDWAALWSQLRHVYVVYGKDRHVAVLDNFKDSKEIICRRLGVVKSMDVVRVSNKLESSKTG